MDDDAVLTAPVATLSSDTASKCSLTYLMGRSPRGRRMSNVLDWKKMLVGSKWHQPGRRQDPPTAGRSTDCVSQRNHFRRQRRSRPVLAGYHARQLTHTKS